MDMKKSKSNMKRAGQDDNGQRSKCQRIESSDESADPTTKITDLNDDCLMKIFGHLDLQSLFNVAVANEWLRPAANDVYKRNFGALVIKICECDDYRPKTRAYVRGEHTVYDDRALKIRNDLVEVRGLKAALQYLRCLGESIKNLKIMYKQSESKRYGRVHQYINDYCAKYLVRLVFEQIPDTAIEQFQTNFVNVERIVLSKSNLTKQWSSFFKWFPNLNCLFLFPEDKTLMPMNVLLDVLEDKQSISELAVINDRSFIPVDSGLVKRLISEHQALDQLILHGYEFTVNDVIAMIRQLKSLTFFSIWMRIPKFSQFMLLLKDDVQWTTSTRDLCPRSSIIYVTLDRKT